MKAKLKHKIQILKAFFYYRRIPNLLLNLSSFYVGKLIGKIVVWGKPFAISIEPTTACNLGCPQCPSGLKSFTRATGKIKVADFENYIQQIYKHIAYVTLYFQGEPYLNPNFTELVAIAKKYHIYTATSTNAHFLDNNNALKTHKSGLNQIIISIDGVSQQNYAHYRLHGNLQTVLTGTKTLIATRPKKSNLHIIWQFIVFKHNEHEIKEIKNLAKLYKIDELRLKTAQIYSHSNAEDWLPTNPKFRRYNTKTQKINTKAAMATYCKRLWTNPVVTWDGNVIPCCFDKDGEHTLGNLKTEPFKTIWKNSAYQNFRKKLHSGRNNINICQNCSEGVKVWI